MTEFDLLKRCSTKTKLGEAGARSMEEKRKFVHIRLRSTGTVLAEGFRGWDMMAFEGNFYIRARCLKTVFADSTSYLVSVPTKASTSGWIFVLRTDRLKRA